MIRTEKELDDFLKALKDKIMNYSVRDLDGNLCVSVSQSAEMVDNGEKLGDQHIRAEIIGISMFRQRRTEIVYTFLPKINDSVGIGFKNIEGLNFRMACIEAFKNASGYDSIENSLYGNKLYYIKKTPDGSEVLLYD